MLKFCSWAFASDHGTLIVFGHSLFFRSFFREFLPDKLAHAAKKSKIVNAGAVEFTLESFVAPGRGVVYSILPESIIAHHGGFHTK